MSLFTWLENKIFGEPYVEEAVAEHISAANEANFPTRKAMADAHKSKAEFDFMDSLYKSWKNSPEKWKVTAKTNISGLNVCALKCGDVRVLFEYPDDRQDDVKDISQFKVRVYNDTHFITFSNLNSYYIVLGFRKNLPLEKLDEGELETMALYTKVLQDATSSLKGA